MQKKFVITIAVVAVIAVATAITGIIISNNNDTPDSRSVPTSDDFTYTGPGEGLLYSSNTENNAKVTVKDGIEGMGAVTVKYYSDSELKNEVRNTKNAGTYYVAVDVASGEDYRPSEKISGDGWSFTVAKIDPVLADFTTSIPDVDDIDLGTKRPTVTPKAGVEGMGDVTVKYYSDSERKNELAFDASDKLFFSKQGTYYFSIDVASGQNYNSAKNIVSPDWYFTVGIIDGTIIGRTFTYDVYGNYGDDYNIFGGTVKMTFVSETTNKYEIRTENNIVTIDSSDVSTPYDKTTTTKWYSKSDILTPSDWVSETTITIHTYWGDKDCNRYMSFGANGTTTCYRGYDDLVMFEQSVENEDYTMILMLSSADYMNYDRTEMPKSYSTTANVTYNTDDEDPATLIAKVDTMTSTWRMIETTTITESDTGTNIETIREWCEDVNDLDASEYGTYLRTESIETEWGELSVKVYSRTEEIEEESHEVVTYLYDDFPIKEKDTNTEDGVVTVTVINEIIIDGEKITDMSDVQVLFEESAWI